MPRNPNKIDYSEGLPDGFEAFEILEDPRTGHHKKHHFGEILFMVVSATLCGMNNFDEISFQASEFIGLTEEEAHSILQQKDSTYLRS